MIKKYVFILAVLLILLLCSFTSIASTPSFRERIHERLQVTSAYRQILERISQIVADNEGDREEIDADEDDDIEDEDAEYDDHSETRNVDGKMTPDHGDEPVIYSDTLDDTSTIDIDGEEGTTLNDETTVVENGDIGITNDMIVDPEGEGRTLDRVIEIITGYNEVIGELFVRVVERAISSNLIESGAAENNVVNTVVENSGENN